MSKKERGKGAKRERKPQKAESTEQKKSLPNTHLILVLVVLVVAVVLIWTSLSPTQPSGTNQTLENLTEKNLSGEQTYEITQVDVFSDQLRDNITGDQISVFGLELGDRLDKCYLVLGQPDDKTEFPEKSIINLEYGASLGLNQTGVLFHFEDYMLTRISFYPPFNQYLKGNTKINHTKREIYDLFGIREREYNIDTRPFITRVLVYDSKGIEFYTNPDEIGFSITYPTESE